MKGLRVVFVDDDPMGLWQEGDEATDMGWESDPTTGVRLLRKHNVHTRTTEVLALEWPYARGLIVGRGDGE